MSVEGWEPALLKKGYQFCYFDGLNRFYVRKEDAGRARWLTTPPNVFDNFLLDLGDARVDMVGAEERLRSGLAEGGLPGLLAQRDDLAVKLERALADAQQGRVQREEFAVRLERALADAQLGQARQGEAEASAERGALAARAAETRLAAVLEVEMPRLESRVREAEGKATTLAEERDRSIVDLAQLCLRFRKLLSERDEAMADATQAQAERVRNRLLQTQLEETRVLLEQHRISLHMIKTSRSWRLMAPFRVLVIRLKLALGLLR